MHIVVTSHGTFCTGALSVYEMVVGKLDGITAVPLSFDDTGQFVGELREVVESHVAEGVLILCDIMGGTPYNESYRLVLEHPGSVEVLANMNLPMLIETGMLRTDVKSLDELYCAGVKAGVKSIKTASLKSPLQEDATEDGDIF